MCSARARRCRGLCDVLFMPQLVTILPHILLSHVCVCSSCPCVCSSVSVSSSSSPSSCCCCCCCCCYPCSFFLILIVAENRQIGGVFAVFSDSESKQHRKYRCCLRLGTPKPRYLRVFFASGGKNRGIYSVLGSFLFKFLFHPFVVGVVFPMLPADRILRVCVAQMLHGWPCFSHMGFTWDTCW